jgi:hypothetical protein
VFDSTHLAKEALSKVDRARWADYPKAVEVIATLEKLIDEAFEVMDAADGVGKAKDAAGDAKKAKEVQDKIKVRNLFCCSSQRFHRIAGLCQAHCRCALGWKVQLCGDQERVQAPAVLFLLHLRRRLRSLRHVQRALSSQRSQHLRAEGWRLLL